MTEEAVLDNAFEGEDYQEEAQDNAAEEQQEEQQEEATPQVNEIEEKARRMGWKPQEEYKGDPDRWTDAETFVKVGEERIPVMKENYRKLEDKYKDLENKVRAQEEYQKHMSKVQYERAMKELQAKQRRAVEDADTEAYEQIEKQKEQIKNDYSPKQPEQNSPPREVVEWTARNPWFNQDFRKTEAAKFYESKLLHLPLNERLEEVSRRVEADFPSQPKQPVRKLPAVESTGHTGGGKKAAKTWSDIPAADRESANQWIKAGILSKEEYIKDYFGE